MVEAVAYLRGLLDKGRAKRMMNRWRHLPELPLPSPIPSLRKVVMIPADPWSLTGSKGDEAMMQGVATFLRSAHPELDIKVVVATEEGRSAAVGMGFGALLAWSKSSFEPIVRAIRECGADLVVVIGADVIDGYYSPKFSLQLIGVADACARLGIRSVLLGFSFNEQPNKLVVEMFSGASSRLAINVRDARSHKRFCQLTGASGRLVADAAFMLNADDVCPTAIDVRTWVAQQRTNGRTILGFNLHPLLVKGRGERTREALEKAAISALERLLENHSVSIALLSHDYRQDVGDDPCLEAVFNALQQRFSDRLLYPRAQLSAAQIKAVAGLMDGVVTGRMHLAIAALGMGVPTAALTYQGKFQGLFDHFELPEDLLLPPGKALDPDQLYALLSSFLERIPVLRLKVAERLPVVKKRSQLNVADLL